MTHENEKRPAANGAPFKTKLSDTEISTENRDAVTLYPPRIRLSDAAENYLDSLSDDLQSGAVDLWQLSPALLKFYTFAALDGTAVAAREQVERLTWERDLWYFCYANRKTPADYYTHQTNELWNQAVAA